jgi:hypothetical protein
MNLISHFTWDSAGLDGHSWERRAADLDEFEQSTDPSGSTPGRVNSVTPVPFDIGIDSIVVEPIDGFAEITISVTNDGLNSLVESYVLLFEVDPDTVVLDSLVFGPLLPLERKSLTNSYLLAGVYDTLVAILPDDDRPENNRVEFIATGSEFPPLVLSEIMANPQAPLETEWVELMNVHTSEIDLNNWQLGDALSSSEIISTAFQIQPHEYVVLARDSAHFRLFYTSFNGTLVQPPQWPTLNNDGDLVRLIDPFGFEALRFVYDHIYADNYSWSRSEDFDTEGQWGRSESAGGTPGDVNRVVFAGDKSELTVTIEPPVFSPDDDGFEDAAAIKIEAPAGSSVTMRVYDRAGRIVRTLIDGESFLQSSYQWDGKTDSGRRLPIGPYILFVEAGNEAIKKPIVIAR